MLKLSKTTLFLLCKRMTIPRLELSAATVAVKLDKMIQEELEIKVHESVFWTDSTSVLR